LNVKIFLINEAKCNQVSILTFIQNTKSLCQKASEAKDSSGNMPVSKFFETITGHQK
jgi:hypothetical protein